MKCMGGVWGRKFYIEIVGIQMDNIQASAAGLPGYARGKPILWDPIGQSHIRSYNDQNEPERTYIHPLITFYLHLLICIRQYARLFLCETMCSQLFGSIPQLLGAHCPDTVIVYYYFTLFIIILYLG